MMFSEGVCSDKKSGKSLQVGLNVASPRKAPGFTLISLLRHT